MAFKMTPEKWAGIAYLAPVAAVGGIWAVLLLVANPPNAGPIDFGFLHYALLEDPERWRFWWLALLPIASLVLSVMYFSTIARAKAGAISLCTVGVVLAVATWLTLGWTIGLLVTLPLLISVPKARNAI